MAPLQFSVNLVIDCHGAVHVGRLVFVDGPFVRSGVCLGQVDLLASAYRTIERAVRSLIHAWWEVTGDASENERIFQLQVDDSQASSCNKFNPPSRDARRLSRTVSALL